MDCFASLAMTKETQSPRQPGYNMLTLYFAPGSSSMAVHIALHEIGVAPRLLDSITTTLEYWITRFRG